MTKRPWFLYFVTALHPGGEIPTGVLRIHGQTKKSIVEHCEALGYSQVNVRKCHAI